jgi:hypothetical protein
LKERNVEISNMWLHSNNSGERSKTETIKFLKSRVKGDVIKRIVEDAINEGKIHEVCNIDNLSYNELKDFLRHGILTQKDLVDKHALNNETKKLLFAHDPNDTTYDLIKCLKLTKNDIDLFAESKSATKLDKYGIEKNMSCEGWAGYISRASKNKNKRLKEFKKFFPMSRNKSEIRRMLFQNPIMLSVLDVDDFKESPMTAKETLSFLKRDVSEEELTLYVTREWVDWLEQELFMETLDGTSKNTMPAQENLEYLKDVLYTKENK